MKQIVRVQQVFDDGTAQILRVRESACSGDCHKCSGCGAEQQKMIMRVQNPIGAKPGDQVIMEAETGAVLKAAAMLYILPVLLFIGAYLVGEWLWKNGIPLSIAGLLLGFVLVRVYDRHLSQKHTTYTITGFSEPKI